MMHVFSGRKISSFTGRKSKPIHSARKGEHVFAPVKTDNLVKTKISDGYEKSFRFEARKFSIISTYKRYFEMIENLLQRRR